MADSLVSGGLPLVAASSALAMDPARSKELQVPSTRYANVPRVMRRSLFESSCRTDHLGVDGLEKNRAAPCHLWGRLSTEGAAPRETSRPASTDAANQVLLRDNEKSEHGSRQDHVAGHHDVPAHPGSLLAEERDPQ